MQCSIITSATIAGLETDINAWLTTKENDGEDITITNIVMSEGTIGSSTLKVIIFYTADYEKTARPLV